MGRAAGLAIVGHQPIKFNRNRLGQVIQETLGNNLKRWFNYDDTGYLVEQTVTAGAGPLFKQEYAYNKTGNLIRKSDSVFGTDKFSYDPLGRITRQIDPVGQVQQYLYDAAGERLVTKINAASSGDNKFHWERSGEIAGQLYRFNQSGNLIERSKDNEKTEFFWDANQRLIKSVSSGQTTLYSYDALGRRISKETKGVLNRFFWDGDALLGDARFDVEHGSENGEPVCRSLREWVYYPGSFEPLAMMQADYGDCEAAKVKDEKPIEQVYYYFNDPNGCPTRLIHESGRIVWAAQYDAWGKVKKLPVCEVEQPLRLQGQYFDGETGLSYNRFRYYDSVIGAFVSRDPLGLTAGENVYLYAPNVQRWIDPLGLSYTPWQIHSPGYNDVVQKGLHFYSNNGIELSVRPTHDGSITFKNAIPNEAHDPRLKDAIKAAQERFNNNQVFREDILAKARGGKQAVIEHARVSKGSLRDLANGRAREMREIERNIGKFVKKGC